MSCSDEAEAAGVVVVKQLDDDDVAGVAMSDLAAGVVVTTRLDRRDITEELAGDGGDWGGFMPPLSYSHDIKPIVS